MPRASSGLPAVSIERLIFTVRGLRVILDADLARLDGAPTKALNRAVKRNADRFPEDFVLRLTAAEAMRCRFGTASKRNVRHRPYAFTEYGAIMAANVLNSPQAVRMSVFVVRAFVQMRELLTGTRELARALKNLETRLTARLDTHETAIVEVLRSVMDILNPPPVPEPRRPRIGFNRGGE